MNEERITVPEEGIETLFGSYDENLKHLESLFNVRIRTQGHELLVDGDAPGLGQRRPRRRPAVVADARRLQAVERRREDRRPIWSRRTRTVDLREHFLKGSLTPAGKRRIAPKTVNQRRYLDAIEQHDIVFGIGPAGTGKTYLAMAQAVSFLVAKKVSRIILARPAVEAGEKLGFLPGDLQEKVNPYLRPLYDALYDMLDVERVARYIERGTIEIAPIAFMRGRTLNDSFVILDEAQNTTSEQMKMFLTRLGFGAKAVITGDITQIDLPTGPHLRPGRGDEGRRRDRGHLVRPLRRSRRRAPQAGAADRQGVRGVLERQRRRGRPPASRRATSLARWLQATTRDAPRACSVDVVDERGRPARCRGLARVAAAVAPAARARRGQHRARQRSARARAEPRRTAARTTRPTCSVSRSARATELAGLDARSPSAPALRSWETSSSPGAWRGARRGRRVTPS